MAQAWEWSKAIWAAIITMATLYIGFQQNQIAAATVRPSLNIDIFPGLDSLRQQYGPLSHAFVITNEGTVFANNVTITVVTKKGDIVIHEDKFDKQGTLGIREEMSYVIHAHDMAGPGELIEELVITYAGIEGWWCDQSFIYRAKYIYDAKEKRWLNHPQGEAKEEPRCI